MSKPLIAQELYWISASEGYWEDGRNWSYTSGGGKCDCIPDAGSRVIFNSRGDGNCLLNVSPSIAAIQVSGYEGKIDLQGYSVSVSRDDGVSTFGLSSIVNTGNAASISITHPAGTVDVSSFVFGAGVMVDFRADIMVVRHSTFNGNTSLYKVGPSIIPPVMGGNTFGSLSKNNNIMTTLGITSGSWAHSSLGEDIFNGPLEIRNESVDGIIQLARMHDCVFNADVNLFSSGAGEIQIGVSAYKGRFEGNAALRTVGSFSGAIYLRNVITQDGDVSLALASDESSQVHVADSRFGAKVAIEASGFTTARSTFLADATFKKTGTGMSSSSGGNTFGGELAGSSIKTILTTTRGGIAFGHSGADVFNGPLELVNDSQDADVRITLAASADPLVNYPCTINGDLTFRCNASNGGTGIGFGAVNGISRTTIASTAQIRTFEIISDTPYRGALDLRRVLCPPAVFFDLTNHENANLTLISCEFETFAAQASRMLIDQTLFNGPCTIHTTGVVTSECGFSTFGGGDAGSSINTEVMTDVSDFILNSNTFNGTAKFVNRSTNANILVTGGDFHNAVQIASSTTVANKGIHFGEFSMGGTDIIFHPTSSLIPALDYQGVVGFFDVTCHVNIDLNIGNCSNCAISSQLSTFNGSVQMRAPHIFLNSSNFFGTTNITKTGSGASSWPGSNIFGGNVADSDISTTIVTVRGSISSGSSGRDVFNGPLVISNESNDANSVITLANSSAIVLRTTNINGDLTLKCNSATANTGIRMGHINLTSNSRVVLATGKTLTVTTPDGVGQYQGLLDLNRFHFASAASIAMTGNAESLLRMTACNFSGGINAEAATVILRNSSFSGSHNVFRAKGSNESTSSNDLFGAAGTPGEGLTEFITEGTGTFAISHGASDTFYHNVAFVDNTGGSDCALSTVSDTKFNGSISLNTTHDMNFGATSIFGGNAAQTISRDDMDTAPFFTNVTLDKTGDGVTLSSPIHIAGSFTFINGVMRSDAGNIVRFLAGSSVTGTPSNDSHIDGPASKSGLADFFFPIGNAGIYRGIGISGITETDTYTAAYFKQNAAATISGGDASTWANDFWHISGCEYWQLQREGTSRAFVTLSWVSDECPPLDTYITDPAYVNVAIWNGSNRWMDAGAGVTTGDGDQGTVTSAARLEDYGVLTLGSTSAVNPLPVQLLSFTADYADGAVHLVWRTETEVNTNYFAVERSHDGREFAPLTTISAAGTTSVSHTYSFTDRRFRVGRNYYRLKPVDYDGEGEYSPVVLVDILDDVVAYPNPAKRGEKISFRKSSTYQVISSTGFLVEAIAGEGELETFNLEPGLYTILDVNTGRTQKIIIK